MSSRISKKDLRFMRGRAAARKGRRKHPDVRARPVQQPVQYRPPGSWFEAAAQSLPTEDPEQRVWYVANVNALVERDLAAGRGVPVKHATAVWQKLERYRLEHRDAMRQSRDEPRWRQHAQALFCTTCKVKFAAHGAAWAESSACGADFFELCRAMVVVDADTPLAQYTMRQLCLALFRLVGCWRQLRYSNDLALYVDHLERRVCAFVTGTFSPEVFDYPRWCARAPPSAGGLNGELCAKQEFLTLMEIYFYEFRRELYDYDALMGIMQHKRRQQQKQPGKQQDTMHAPAYEPPSAEVLQRADAWVAQVSESVYEEVVMETFREAYVESRLLPGEREFYEYENEDEEGVAQSAQSVISHFRADELDEIEGNTSLKLSAVLAMRGEARDLAVLSMLEFHYSSVHPGKGRSFADEYIVQRENASPLQLAQHDPSDASSVSQLQRVRHASDDSTLLGRPVLMRAFHTWCVYDPNDGLTACADFVAALCCWMQHAFGGTPTRRDTQAAADRERMMRARARRSTFAEVESGLRTAYRFIFKGVDERDTEQMRAERLYNDVPNLIQCLLPWNPYASR